MFKIQKLNKISPKGLELLPADLYESASEILNPDAILVRSAEMHDLEMPASLKAIARVGVGFDNIPVEKCSQKGIIVFNTPGTNANAVKELVIMSLFMSSRDIVRGIEWAQGMKGKGGEVPALIEAGKAGFEGPEIKGKKVGIIGLGAIGVMVANDAHALGMEVSGYDPFISVDAAWGLSREVKKAISLDNVISDSDYITLHLPLNESTRGLLNKEKFAIMKKGVRIINFARGGLVNNLDLLEAMGRGIVKRYVTDFPDDEILGVENIIPVPHLGASTPESEDNSAVMAVTQLRAFLENGNISNSVNYPDCMLARSGKSRLVIANRNVPNIIGQVTHILAQRGINIANMLNKSMGEYAYNIIDIDGVIPPNTVESLKKVEHVIMARIIE